MDPGVLCLDDFHLLQKLFVPDLDFLQLECRIGQLGISLFLFGRQLLIDVLLVLEVLVLEDVQLVEFFDLLMEVLRPVLQFVLEVSDLADFRLLVHH